MKKPNFFIIGAPKCGTTSLASWLDEHPQVYMSSIKEPNFFNRDLWTPNRISEHNYKKLFINAKKYHVRIGEASTRYLYSKCAVKNILSYCDSPKFIAIVRNPVEMIYSLHNHLVFLGVEQFNDFGKAWHLRDIRKNGLQIIKNCTDPDSLSYGTIGLLGEQVEKFFEYVPQSNRLVIVFDDLNNSPEIVYQDIMDFLELDFYDRNDFSPKNKSMCRRSKFIFNFVILLAKIKKATGIKKSFGLLQRVNDFNRREKERKSLDVNISNELVDYFHEDVLKLGRLLGRDLSHWLKA